MTRAFQFLGYVAWMCLGMALLTSLWGLAAVVLFLISYCGLNRPRAR
jgi:protein-S-isoprenylcysteine O-methyltransferase Ste14